LSDNKKRSSCLVIFIGWIAGIFTGIILFVILLISLVMNFGKQSIIVKNNSYLILDYSGEIVERPITQGLSDSINPRKLELLKYLSAIEYAASDDRIAGIVINGDLTFYNKAYNDEIGYSLTRFKKSGKKVYAWFSSGINSNYALCLNADKIFMPKTKSATLSLSGYSLNIPYYKDALDKLGVEFTVVHIGNYKGAFEDLSHNAMTDKLRESYISILDNLYNQYINDISVNRNINREKLLEYFKLGKTIAMTPDEAKDMGFIDDIQSYEELKQSISKDFISIPVSMYISAIKKKNLSVNKIAVVYAEGTISNYYSYDAGFDGSIVGAKTFIEDLENIKNDKSIKAVVIRVNSSGGSALASELILQEILKVKKIKPVIVSFGPIAASGGYYISCAGQKIFTNNSTLTGSIGVVSLFMNYKKLTDKIGIKFEQIKKNKFDDFMSQNKTPTDEEVAIIKKSMLGIYKEFTDHVVKERKIEEDKISSLAEGRVWTGYQAIQNKLADEKGGLIDAIEYASTVGNSPAYNIESFPKPPSFWDKLSRLDQLTMLKIEDKQIRRLIELAVYYRQNGKQASMILPFYDLP